MQIELAQWTPGSLETTVRQATKSKKSTLKLQEQTELRRNSAQISGGNCLTWVITAYCWVMFLTSFADASLAVLLPQRPLWRWRHPGVSNSSKHPKAQTIQQKRSSINFMMQSSTKFDIDTSYTQIYQIYHGSSLLCQRSGHVTSVLRSICRVTSSTETLRKGHCHRLVSAINHPIGSTTSSHPHSLTHPSKTCFRWLL